MAVAKVSPNRMELLKNRRRLALAKRGHKLLKDKYDELIRKFVQLIKENANLRKETENELRKLYVELTKIRAESPINNFLNLIERSPLQLTIEIKLQHILNVKAPVIKAETKNKKNYPLGATPLAFDSFLRQFEQTIKMLLNLAQFEHSARLLATEIEKTRRRVNALEHVLLPQLQANIRFISMKMDEIDRENRTRFMKIKEMLATSASV